MIAGYLWLNLTILSAESIMGSFISGVVQFDLDVLSVGAFYIFLFVLLSAVGQILVKRWMGTETIALCHEVGGYYMALVGSMYSVILGLVIYDSISNFGTASLAVKDEAKSLMAVYSLADQFPGNGKAEVKALTQDYVKEICENEWALMDENTFSHKARMKFWDLMDAVKQIEPRSENQRVVLPILINESLMAWSARRERIEKIGMGIPKIEWFALLVGAVVTIVFTYFFTIAIGTVQLLMTAMVAFTVAINLYLVLLFGNPYSGDLRIPSTAFDVLNQYINSHLSFLDGAEKGGAGESIGKAHDWATLTQVDRH